MERKRVVILKSDDWEGLYVDQELISEDHHLGSGDYTFLLKMAESHKFSSNDVIIKYITDEDAEIIEDNGNFPQLLSDLIGKYDEII